MKKDKNGKPIQYPAPSKKTGTNSIQERTERFSIITLSVVVIVLTLMFMLAIGL
tara:strand:+ start:291 stop:452 length:162 start_codon:yes stop_codon:yes gene_type:complete